jgi:cytosine/adenosine deaminase-related metal-dependent hydrolase
MHERLSTHTRGRFTPAELVTAATATGYDSLGWPGGGRLRVGAPADLVVADPSSIRTSGARPDQLHYAATAADVTDVIIGGDHVVRDRVHRLGAVGPLISDALTALEDR